VGVISIAQLIVNLGLLIPTLAVSVRRLHDTDRSGWWLLAPLAGLPVFLIGLAGTGISVLQPGGTPNFGGMFAILAIGGLLTLGFGIMVFVFTCLDGTRGPNRFGPDPKDPNGDLETVFS
jgi:uncharacterized membrane protein YhaH (DUF805 family)